MKKITKVNFLEVKKTPLDKFHDITERYKHEVFKKKKGEFSKRIFYNIISKELKIKNSKIKNLFSGQFTKADIKKINKLHKGEKTKKQSKKFIPEKEISNLKTVFSDKKDILKGFTKHTFTFDNFFKKKAIKIKKNEQFYFRAGLHLVFRSKNSGTYMTYNGKEIQVWTIPNLPISHYDFKGYPRGYKKMFDKIQETLNSYDSLLFFFFNYFDVSILDMTK